MKANCLRIYTYYGANGQLVWRRPFLNVIPIRLQPPVTPRTCQRFLSPQSISGLWSSLEGKVGHLIAKPELLAAYTLGSVFDFPLRFQLQMDQEKLDAKAEQILPRLNQLQGTIDQASINYLLLFFSSLCSQRFYQNPPHWQQIQRLTTGLHSRSFLSLKVN